MRKLSRALWHLAEGRPLTPAGSAPWADKIQKQETRDAETLPCHPNPRRATVLTGFRRSDLQPHPVVSTSEYPPVVARHSPDLLWTECPMKLSRCRLTDIP